MAMPVEEKENKFKIPKIFRFETYHDATYHICFLALTLLTTLALERRNRFVALLCLLLPVPLPLYLVKLPVMGPFLL